MRRLLFLIVLLAASSSWALPASLSPRKIYGREIYTSADKTADDRYFLDLIEDVYAYFPGTDSLKITRVVTDTLHASGLNRITVAPADTLQMSYLDVTRRAYIDSILTGTQAPVVGFSSAWSNVSIYIDSVDVTVADINGGTIDGTVIGGATAAAGSFTRVAGSIAASFTGGLTTNQVRATSKAVFSAASSVLMPTAIQMPSGTDGYALTSDGRGRVVLEAVPTGTVVDTTSTIAIPFSDGTSALPALTNLGDLNTGIYFPAADQVGVSVNGVRALLVSGDDITVRDDANVGDDLNLTSSGGVINFNAGDVTLTHSADLLTIAGAASGYQFNGVANNAALIGGSTTTGVGIKVFPTTTVANAVPLYVLPTFGGGNGGDRTIYAYSIANASNNSEMNGLRCFGLINGGVTLASYMGVYIANPTATGTLTNNYGLYIESQTAGGTDYAIYSGGGAVNMQQLDASSAVSTDASKNLTTASDSSWKVDRGELVDATTILRALRPKYWTWKKDSHGLLTDPRRPAPWARTRAEAWTQITGRDSTTALSQTAPSEREALRAKVRKVKTLEDQPRLAGFFAQEVYAVLPEGSPGGANTDSLGKEHWGLNTTAILAVVTASLQEQIGRVDSLAVVTARQDILIADLMVRVAKLEAR